MRGKLNRVLLLAAVVVLAAGATQAVTIDLVPVGNPGNAADTRHETPGYGAVDYSYQIGTYEVTAGQYTEFLNAVAGVDVYGLYNSSMWSDTYGCKIERFDGSGTLGDPYQYRVAADRTNRPVNYVSFWDAARFCNWLDNGQGDGDTETGAYINIDNQATFARTADATWVIPTEDEWYKAAYHKNDGLMGSYWDYPTGTNDVPSNDLVTPDPGNNANFYISGGDNTIGDPYYTTEVGEFENSESPYGTFDQGGNVWEWNETAIGSSRGVRGGCWGFYSDPLRASNRGSSDPTNEKFTVGFRVASVPEPGSITLLLCGLLSLICLRRRK